MIASETRNRKSRVRGFVLFAAVNLAIGVALSAWARFQTDITRGLWAVLLIAVLAVVLMLLGPKVVKR